MSHLKDLLTLHVVVAHVIHDNSEIFRGERNQDAQSVKVPKTGLKR